MSDDRAVSKNKTTLSYIHLLQECQMHFDMQGKVIYPSTINIKMSMSTAYAKNYTTQNLILYLVVNIGKPLQNWDTLTKLRKFSVVKSAQKQ